MLDRMCVPAAREDLAPPRLVTDLLVMHVPVEDAREGPDDLANGIGAPDHGKCASRGPLGPREQADRDPRHVFGRDQRQNGVFVAKRQADGAARGHACTDKARHVLVEHGGAKMQRADARPFKHLFGEIVLPHARRRRIDRRLIHHEIDQPRNAMLARRKRHRGRGVRQPVLHRIGKIDRRDILRGLFERTGVEEIADKNFGAERFQAIGTLVDLADEGTDGHAALQQHFGYMAAGSALGAAGG
jgi:hypothetical protein